MNICAKFELTIQINCVAEILWDEAIERAKYLDSLPSPIGPLHGLPISMKGQQGMAIYNKPSHGGYVAWVDKPSEPNPINDILFDAGCVYYVRTTEPQTTMHVECNNNIYGKFDALLKVTPKFLSILWLVSLN